MQLAMLVAACVLSSQAPGEASWPTAAQLPPPAMLQPIAEPAPATTEEREDTVPQTTSAPAGVDAAVKAETEGRGETEADTSPADTPPPPPPAKHRLTPPEMVAEALVLPPDCRITGRPFTLVTALSSAPDPRLQLEVTHAYWRLAEAVAVYHFSLDYERQLRDLQVEGDPAPPWRTARASCAALVREAEVAAVAAQHELAALALLSPDVPLPLPADRPHVGPYRTQFEQLFSMRTPPPRARLIDRTLPILYRAVDGRASAVEAAHDALTAAVDAHQSGRADLPAVLASLEEYLRQRRAFFQVVCRYNHEIAEYALAVTGPGSNAQVLVGMLINPTPQPVRPLVSGGDGWVEPVGHNQRVPTPARRPGQNAPTPAQRLDQKQPTPAQRPGQAPPPGSPQAAPGAAGNQVPPPDTQWSPSQAPGQSQPPSTRRREGPDVSKPTSAEQSSLPVSPSSAGPTPNTANKLVADVPGNPRSPAVYPALANAPPETQAQQLTLTLHAARILPEGAGQRVSLGDCLSRRSQGDRGELIGAYWVAGQRVAEYQVLAQARQWFEDLLFVPQDERLPSALQLRAAMLSTGAALTEAHAALLDAQFALATRIGRESDGVWPIPSTAPRSTPYPLTLDTPPDRPAESWPVRRLAAMIPGLAESVQHRATAVVEADAARAAASSSPTGDRSIEPVLACINQQTEETLAFLGALTEYNRMIAEYALTVLPPETADQKLIDLFRVAP
jgi:hypothetical protein